MKRTRYSRKKALRQALCEELIRRLYLWPQVHSHNGFGDIQQVIGHLHRIREFSKRENEEKIFSGLRREEMLLQGALERCIGDGIKPLYKGVASNGRFKWDWYGSPQADLLMDVLSLSEKGFLAWVGHCVVEGCKRPWFFDRPDAKYCPKHRNSDTRVAVKRARDKAQRKGV